MCCVRPTGFATVCRFGTAQVPRRSVESVSSRNCVISLEGIGSPKLGNTAQCSLHEGTRGTVKPCLVGTKAHVLRRNRAVSVLSQELVLGLELGPAMGRQRNRRNTRKRRKHRTLLAWLKACFVPAPQVVDDEEPPLMSVQKFREMHRRRQPKGKQVSFRYSSNIPAEHGQVQTNTRGNCLRCQPNSTEGMPGPPWKLGEGSTWHWPPTVVVRYVKVELLGPRGGILRSVRLLRY